ncbi:hypothetical protein [Aliarcobacter butzleri]|uniref:Uncharacterized protein n=1 Tax=Aliarcobacter butzleri L348 TaxID=1447256 RepID=A0A0G9JWN1_9BACT|nr:hypothetical protein [Aliarcobacter butzleri]KLD98663.1 hypothetical protein AA20_08200 [Aliarcobacter butzleri L348]
MIALSILENILEEDSVENLSLLGSTLKYRQTKEDIEKKKRKNLELINERRKRIQETFLLLQKEQNSLFINNDK